MSQQRCRLLFNSRLTQFATQAVVLLAMVLST